MKAVGQPAASPPLLAHRGYAARYPENTREALRAAVEAGAEFIEFDIQLSADAVPFLLHDADFLRTGNTDQSILDITAAEVAAIPVGEPDRFGKMFSAVRAPRLSAVVDDLRDWENVTAFVEIKRQSIERFGLAAVLDSVLPVLQPVLARCVIISFDADAVRESRERTGCRIGWALRSWDEDAQQLATTLAPDYLFCNLTRLPQLPEPLWTGPWTWVVYEITTPEEVQMLADRGVGMIETMAYTELAAGLARAPASNMSGHLPDKLPADSARDQKS